MERPPGSSRRTFLKQAALSIPAFAALPRLAHAMPAVTPQGAAEGPKRKVIVVGAGLAGLAAAYELDALGHDVTVLEAQLRPGGRVYTLRFASGLYAEAGALGWSDSPYIRRYIEAFDLPAVPIGPQPLNRVYHLRGQRLLAPPGQEPEWPYDFAADEKELGWRGMLINYLFRPGAELGDPTAESWQVEPYAQLDDLTLAQFMRDRGASDEAIELLSRTLVLGYGWDTGSALHRLVSDIALFTRAGSGRVLVIDGGADQFPKAFAKALRDRIFYGAPVARIEQDESKVRAVYRQAGADAVLEADHLVVTAPCPALRRIEFDPPLSGAKRKIVDELEHVPVTRTFLQARRRIWEEAGNVGNAFTDLPIGLVSEHPILPQSDRGSRGILESHLKGADAEKVSAMDQEARLAFTVEEMEKVHPGFKQHYEGGTSVDWGADPWAGGGYAWWRPGQLLAWQPELARAEGRVHFAGDHTALLARTLEGALESGNRAAKEVHEAGS